MKKLELCECSLPEVNTESFHMVQHYKADDVRVWAKGIILEIQAGFRAVNEVRDKGKLSQVDLLHFSKALRMLELAKE